MTYFAPDRGGSTPETGSVSPNQASPDSLLEVLTLPEEQRQLVLWLVRQGMVTLEAIALHLGVGEMIAEARLTPLIQMGLVQRRADGRYRAFTPQRRSQQSPQTLAPPTSAVTPLGIILSSPGQDAIAPGGTFELGVTVSNRGGRSAVIDVLIQDMAPPLRPWCRETQGSLALAPGQAGEVVFTFAVPANALPGTFRYLVVVDAPDHYPEFPPARYPQELQVLTPIQDRIETADPTFALLPSSQAQAPLSVPPGGLLQFQVQIFNRSPQVDRFRLVCLDLPPQWIKFDYPQSQEGLGLVPVADSLGLNPGDRGSVSLTISPPADAIAGIYTPTLQLRSENRPDLALLDLIYLQVQPIYALQGELIPQVNRAAGARPAQFQIYLCNQGNSSRQIDLSAQGLDGADLCLYTLGAEQITLAPHQAQGVTLTARPHRRWQRPWFGGGRLLTFQVAIADPQGLPVLTPRLQSYFTWAARPWWQLLLALVAAGGTILALLWLLWWLFFRPPAVAQVVEFFVEDDRYAAVRGDRVQVGWQIRHPHRLQALRLVGLTPDGAVLSGPLNYDLSGEELPRALAPFCTQTHQLLSCRQVYTDARLPGDYIFELTLIPQGEEPPPAPVRAPLVTIDPIPFPAVLEVVASQTQYLEGPLPIPPGATTAPLPPVPPLPAGGILLSWVVTTSDNLQDLLLVARNPDGTVVGGRRYRFRDRQTGEVGIPADLQPFCSLGERLVCQDVATGLGAVGDYTFEVIPVAFSEPETPLEGVTTEVVRVLPLPVQLFALLVNGQPALPKYVVPITPGQPPLDLLVSWEIAGGSTATATLDPAPGAVPLRGQVSLPVNQEPGSQTLTLTLSNGSGEPIRHAITIETYNPNPTDAAAIAAAVAAAAGDNGAAPPPPPTPSGPPLPPALDRPLPSDPGRLSPSETPPQFQ